MCENTLLLHMSRSANFRRKNALNSCSKTSNSSQIFCSCFLNPFQRYHKASWLVLKEISRHGLCGFRNGENIQVNLEDLHFFNPYCQMNPADSTPTVKWTLLIQPLLSNESCWFNPYCQMNPADSTPTVKWTLLIQSRDLATICLACLLDMQFPENILFGQVKI